MNLYLSLDHDVTPQSSLWHELPSLQTVIEVVLSDSHRNKQCGAVEKPGGTFNIDGVPVLTKGFGIAHWCESVQFRPFDSYELVIRIKAVDSRTGNISVVPLLGTLECELP